MAKTISLFVDNNYNKLLRISNPLFETIIKEVVKTRVGIKLDIVQNIKTKKHISWMANSIYPKMDVYLEIDLADNHQTTMHWNETI